MKINILQKLIIFSCLVLAGNGVIGYAVYNSSQKRLETEKWVEHTQQIIYQTGNILSLGKDIESSGRGYVITKDSAFLEPLFKAEKSIFTNIEQLRQLTNDIPEQKQQVDSLNFYLKKRLAVSYQVVEIRNKMGLASAITYVSTKQGKHYFDHIRQITSTIQEAENNLLQQRKQVNDHSLNSVNRFSVIMFALMTAFTILLLVVTGKILLQIKEKEMRAAELIIANTELAFQNEEKEKRAAELILANKELAFQNEEKEKRADELILANRELAYQNDEKGKRAAELVIANEELHFQNKEKEKRAAELILANKELVFQDHEKENRAAELIIANNELVFQNEEKEKRADELISAYKKLVFQNEEKEERAAELVIAEKELVYQNEEKGKRAAELVTANREVVFQSEEKEKQEAANKELEAFSYSVSHDLRAPLRHIGGFVDLLIKNNSTQLDQAGIRYLNIISESSHEMGNLIDALLTFSRLSRTELQRTEINTNDMVKRVVKTFDEELVNRNVEINVSELPETMGDENLINQVWINLISNALKYSRNVEKAVIDIQGKAGNDKTIFQIKDNGAGFDMKYADKLFGVFQRLHKARDFEGIGIGLANVNRIVVRHGGTCWAESETGQGATFFFSLANK